MAKRPDASQRTFGTLGKLRESPQLGLVAVLDREKLRIATKSGEFSDAVVIARFGAVPEHLTELMG